MFSFSYPLEVYPNQRDDNNVDEGDGDGIKPPMHRMSCGERNQNRTIGHEDGLARRQQLPTMLKLKSYDGHDAQRFENSKI